MNYKKLSKTPTYRFILNHHTLENSFLRNKYGPFILSAKLLTLKGHYFAGRPLKQTINCRQFGERIKEDKKHYKKLN
jgi:hypothetical protein